MPTKAKIYLTVCIVVGGAVILRALLSWQSATPSRFLCYCLLALIASSFKVRLPGITGTMSVNFLFILLGVVELSFSETVLMGSACIVLQTVWRARKRPRLIQAAFNVTSIAIATALAYLVFHALEATSTDTALPLLLGASASVYFITNTGMVTAIVSMTEGSPMMRTWKECYFWSFPYYILGAGLVGAMSAMQRSVGWQTTLFLVPLLYWIYRSYRGYLDRLEAEKQHASQVADLHLRTIEALALAIDAKDHCTHNHVRRVETYAVEIGREMGLSSDELRALRAAAMLHDIGKLGVPDQIISKPGRLTEGEFEKMKSHPVIGGQIVELVKFPYPVAPIVRAHHEKWDGSGYPDGLRGEQIPLGARILAAVDCLDAVASNRQYRPALSLDEAMAFVASEAGKGYDPAVVRILQRRYRELEVLARQRIAGSAAGSEESKRVNGSTPATGLETLKQGSRGNAPQFIQTIAAARQEAQELFELTKELGNSLSLAETLSVLGVRLMQLVPHDAIAIYVREGQALIPRFVSGKHSRFITQMQVGEGLSGWVAQHRTPVLNGNPAVEPDYLHDPATVGSLLSAVSVPLEGPDSLVGVLTLYDSEKEAFSTDHLRLLQAVTYKMAQAIQNALQFSQAETNASRDALTGLPNARSLFVHLDEELARSRRTGRSLSVLVCDLDGFKELNDRFGHLEGNKILRLVAHALDQNSREYDYVARMGGDEFVLVLPECPKEQVAALQIRLSRAVEQLGREMYGQLVLGMSIGEAHNPQDGGDAEQLLAVADRRMYEQKRQRHGILPATSPLEVHPVLLQ